MAKGSLLGKADTTLAQMSYREAMADVTPDLGDIYKEEVLTQAIFQKGVSDHFDKLHADYNSLGDELKDATTKAMADLSAGITPDDEGIEMYNTYLGTLKDRWKGTAKGKKGDLERAKIRAELNRLKNSTTDLNTTMTSLGTMIENDQFDPKATGGNNLSLFTAIANRTAKREIVNGQLQYSIPNPVPGGKDITVTQSELKDKLVLKDPKFGSDFVKIGAGYNATGKQKGTTFDLQGAINSYETSFPSKHAFATNIHNKQGSLKYSFADALSGKDPKLAESIYTALMGMGDTTIAKYDVVKDGVIDAKDFANKENGIALIKSLTDIHYKDENDNSLFDYQTAKSVAAEFYAKNIAKNEFNAGTKTRGGEGPIWKQLGFSDFGKYEEYLKGRGKPKNRNVEFQLFMSKTEEGDKYEKTTTTSDEIINLDTQLNDLMGQNSLETGGYVNLFGKKIGYFPGSGFAPIGIKDGQLYRDTKIEGGFWKNPIDVFQNYSIPTTYSKKRYVIGKIYTQGGKKYKYVGGDKPWQPV